VAETHEVLGRTVTMPVEIRTASAVTAMFPVPASAAQRMVDYSGLRVLRPVPGRAVVVLLHVRYVDGDLGAYDEVGVAVLVHRHDTLLAPGVLIHRLPVDGEFTMAAGRKVWGFPKELADFDVSESDGRRRVVLTQHGDLVVDLTVSAGLPVPARVGRTALRAYTHLHGVTRCTDWEMAPSGVRCRPGGARAVLGDHPIGRELAELGLPRRALVTTTIGNARMRFGEALVVAR
jgi:hypothetical protein